VARQGRILPCLKKAKTQITMETGKPGTREPRTQVDGGKKKTATISFTAFVRGGQRETRMQVDVDTAGQVCG
jgi:hypothetical protein